MKFLLEICLFFVSVTAIASVKWKCDKSAERKVDAIMAKIMTYGNSGRKYPVNRQELKTYCEEHYRLILEVEDYKNQCLNQLSKQSISVILFSIKNMINQYCKKNTRKVDDLLLAAPCANSATNEFNKCNANYIDALLAAQNVPDAKMRIPQTCCEYHKIFDCIHTRGIRVNGCTEKQLDVCEDYIKSHFENVLSLLCAEYSEQSDKCKGLPKLVKRKNQRRTKSFILPLMKLLEGIPEI